MPNRTISVTPGVGATINTLPDVGQQTKANSLPFTLASDTDALPLSPDAATATKQDEAKVVLASILTAIQGTRSETIWTDNTGQRFIRVDAGQTISWTDVAGNPIAAPGTGARPDYDSGDAISRSVFSAITSGTGFVTGDYLEHFVVVDASSGNPVSNFWINSGSGTRIVPPSANSIAPLNALAAGAASDAKLEQIRGILATGMSVVGPLTDAQLRAAPVAVSVGEIEIKNDVGNPMSVSASALPLPNGAGTSANQGFILTALGSATEATPASDTAASGLNGRLQRIAQRLSSLIALLPTALSAGGNLKVSLSESTITPNFIPQFVIGGNIEIVTPLAGGTAYTVLGNQAAKQVTFVNITGTQIEVQQGATGPSLPLLDGSCYTFYGISNTNQLGLRRSDGSSTPVTVSARWEA